MLTAGIHLHGGASYESVHDVSKGLDLIGAYTDGITIVETASFDAQTDGKYLRARHVGFSALDPAIDLHVIVTDHVLNPRVGFVNGQIATGRDNGAAYHRTGVSMVSTFKLNGEGMTKTTAHEGAHSLGFVNESSFQLIQDEFGCHCADASCTMAPTNVAASDGFCTPCEADMRLLSVPNIELIRGARKQAGEVVVDKKIDPKRVMEYFVSKGLIDQEEESDAAV